MTGWSYGANWTIRLTGRGSELVFDSEFEFAPDTGDARGFFALGQFDIRVGQVPQPGLEFPIKPQTKKKAGKCPAFKSLQLIN